MIPLLVTVGPIGCTQRGVGHSGDGCQRDYVPVVAPTAAARADRPFPHMEVAKERILSAP